MDDDGIYHISNTSFFSVVCAVRGILAVLERLLCFGALWIHPQHCLEDDLSGSAEGEWGALAKRMLLVAGVNWSLCLFC